MAEKVLARLLKCLNGKGAVTRGFLRGVFPTCRMEGASAFGGAADTSSDGAIVVFPGFADRYSSLCEAGFFFF